MVLVACGAMEVDPNAARVSAESVRVVADSVGVALEPDVAEALAPDVEYRLREVVQEACKFMRHSRRRVLSTEDVNAALRLLAVEPLYGFSSREPLEFRAAAGNPDLYFLSDRELRFDDLTLALLPPPPLDVNLVPHWLAVEGVQPLIPENVGPDNDGFGAAAGAPPPKRVKGPGGEAAAAPDPAAAGAAANGVKPVVAHVVSQELRLYFVKISEIVKGVKGDADALATALESLATDTGLNQLVPYFVQLVTDETTANIRNLTVLNNLIRMVRALVSNTSLSIEPYLHQIMPPVITCMVAKRLSASPTEDHWSLRDAAASVLAFIVRRFGGAYPNIQPRITRTLLRAFLDPSRPLPTHYGAIIGLSALGPRVVRAILLPNLPSYLALLMPELEPAAGGEDGGASQLKRHEAQRCFGALQTAAGGALYRCLVPAAPAWGAPAPAGTARPMEAEGNGAGAAQKLDGVKVGGKLRVARPAAPGAAKADGMPPSVLDGTSRSLEDAWHEGADERAHIEALAESLGSGFAPFAPTEPLATVFV